MKRPLFFDKPLLSVGIALLILIAGIAGFVALPTEQYPSVAPTAIRVQTLYPGASAKTVAQAVAISLEQELNGTPGMLYMESSSSNSGAFTATLTFDQSVNIDEAITDIRHRLSLAETRLPAEVLEHGMSVEVQPSGQLMTLCLASSDPKFDEIYLSNFATIHVIDPLQRLPGVGRIQNIGGRYYAMQIWVQPDKLANFGITVQDLQNALKDQNRESAAGVLGEQPSQGLDITIPITTRGRLNTIGDFEEIVVRAEADGSLIRLRDVARLSLEASSYQTESGIDGKNVAVLGVYMLPGTDAQTTARGVKKALKEISKSFPEGISYAIPFDTTTYISQSVHAAYWTLFESLFLVSLVVFLTLQNWRSTLLTLTVAGIALAGTLGVLAVAGFSLNILTVLGLGLSAGLAVTHTLLLILRVKRILNTGQLNASEATLQATNELSHTLFTTALAGCAAFIPLLFLHGISGTLYHQIAITVAASVLIATGIAATLSPALCARLLKPDAGQKKPPLFRFLNYQINRWTIHYVKGLRKAFTYPRTLWIGAGMMLAVLLSLSLFLPSSLLPGEDQGYFNVELELPEGATLERTRKVTERAVQYIQKIPQVEQVLHVTGYSPRLGNNQAHSELTVLLKPWSKRTGTSFRETMEHIQEELTQYPEAKVYLSTPPVLPGLGTTGGFEMQLEVHDNGTLDELARAVDTLLYYASQQQELTSPSSSMQLEVPQLYFDIDRDKVKMLGIQLADVFSTMKAYTGSIYVNDFNMFNRVYKVYIQAEAPYRAHRDNINLFFVRGSSDVMVPLTALGTTSYTAGAGTIQHFNMLPSAALQGEANTGYTSGQAMKAMEQVAKAHLPENSTFSWSGLSYLEQQAGGANPHTWVLAFLCVVLVLMLLYKNPTLPAAALLTMLLAATGAYLGAWLCGTGNNLYFQAGVMVLAGVATRHALLFAVPIQGAMEAEKESIQTVLHTARARIRPIWVASLVAMASILPMVLAGGPGAATQQSLGTGFFFGILFSLLTGAVLVPLFLAGVYHLKKRAQSK